MCKIVEQTTRESSRFAKKVASTCTTHGETKNKQDYLCICTHRMMTIASVNRICSSASRIRYSVCLPIQWIKPRRAKHSIVMNMAPKNTNVTHSIC